jgi:hypothetical protein
MSVTIYNLPLSRRLTRRLEKLELIELDEIQNLTVTDLRQGRLDRKGRVELARALLLRKARCDGSESG